MPDNIFKSDDVNEEGTGVTVQNMGAEEEFAQDVLKSLKEKISEARDRLEELEDEIESKKEEAEATREELLEEAREEAEDIRRDAQEEAREIIENKENEVEQAREEGYQDGYSDGKQEAQEDMAEYLEQSREILSEAKREQEAHLSTNKETLVLLSEKMAAKVVRDSISVDGSTAERVVEDALSEVSDVQEITIVLHPEDASAVREARDELIDSHANLEDITIAEDSKLERGGCRVETSYGDIQGTLEEQLEHLSESLLDD